jgi:hypothetical protein
MVDLEGENVELASLRQPDRGGFEEVVDGGGIEGGDGVFVVGGDEDDAGVGGGAGGFEAGQAGHADVEECVLGAKAGELGDGF